MATRWNVAEVPAEFAQIAELADKHGYLAALFGSTVKNGAGRDLDVLMQNRFGERGNWQQFLCEFGGAIVNRYERAERGNHSWEVEKENRLYHFCFGRF